MVTQSGLDCCCAVSCSLPASLAPQVSVWNRRRPPRRLLVPVSKRAPTLPQPRRCLLVSALLLLLTLLVSMTLPAWKHLQRPTHTVATAWQTQCNSTRSNHERDSCRGWGRSWRQRAPGANGFMVATV